MNGILKTAYEDEDSDQWEQIKSFVGGANKQHKHPLQQEAERIQMREPEGYAQGGPVMPELLSTLTPGSSTQVPLNALHGTIPAPDAVSPQVAEDVTAQPPAVEAIPEAPAPASIPSPAYDKQASDILGGITQESIDQLMQSLDTQNRRGQIGVGLAGIGDAIASVGGVNPGHMKGAQGLLQANREAALKVPGMKAQVGKDTYGLSKELESSDPSSPYSKIAQRTYGPDLLKMGVTQQEISRMPASLITDLFAKKVTLEEAKARIAEDATYKRGMLANAKAQTQQAAAAGLGKRGLIKRATEGVFGESPETKLLKEQVAGQPSAPEVTSQVEYEALPVGARYTSGGVSHIKRSK